MADSPTPPAAVRADRSETPEARAAHGKSLREQVPRSSHAVLPNPGDQRDPIAILSASDAKRVPELLPIRYGRMSESPFAFFRGGAAIMASDLAATPTTGLRTQLCGDAHLMNFGSYASPERELVFDVNDFDETLPGPWEWDVKRLAASVAVAGRTNNFSTALVESAVTAASAGYRTKMLACASMPPLDVWYSRVDAQTIAKLRSDALAKYSRRIEKRAATHTSERTFPKLTGMVDGRLRIVDQPPLIYHDDALSDPADAKRLLAEYRSSLRPEQRVLFDRYVLLDVAVKVVGVGSVGTRCLVSLLVASGRDPLLLQMKEATTSVLAPFAGHSVFEDQGERVVTGQRLMQSASDILLGWTGAIFGSYYYVRQLRDMKTSAEIAEMSPAIFIAYAQLCGLTLARAHARGGDPAAIAGYLGRNRTFDGALVQFAHAYADQNDRDYAALKTAIAAGRVAARLE